MAYDFAKRKKKRKTRKQAELSTRPVWLASGVALGLFIAFLAQLGGFYFVSPKNTPVTVAAKPPAKKEANSSKSSSAEAAQSESRARFEFYNVLPERELKVNQDSKVAYKTREEVGRKPLSYLLQAGSFAQAQDAQTRRAAITLLNLTAKVESARLPSGVTAHRVFVGPFDDRGKMLQARSDLSEEGIETLLMEKRGH